MVMEQYNKKLKNIKKYKCQSKSVYMHAVERNIQQNLTSNYFSEMMFQMTFSFLCYDFSTLILHISWHFSRKGKFNMMRTVPLEKREK